MLRMFLVGLSMAAVVLAGCVTTDVPAPPPTGDRESLALPVAGGVHKVAYVNCNEQDVGFPIPMADAKSGLPAGFAPIPFDETGQLAVAVIWTDRCGAGEAGEAAIESPGEIWGYLPVTVPDAYKNASVGGYLVVLGGIINDAHAAAAYHSWGVSLKDVTVGGVSLSTLGDSSSPYHVSMADASDGNFSVSTSVTSAGLTYFAGGGRIRAFNVANSTVVGAFDNVFSPYRANDQSLHATVVFSGNESPINIPSAAYAGFGTPLFGISYSNEHVDLVGMKGDAATAHAPQAGPLHLKGLVIG